MVCATGQWTFLRVSTSPDVSVVRATEAIYDAITVDGFKRTETKLAVGIRLSISDVRFQGSESTSRYEDVKDKDGKITGRTYHYKITARYSVNGSYSIMGPGKDDEVKKPEPAPAAKTNLFLANVTKAPDQAAPNEGKRIGGGQLPMQLVFTSQEYTTSGQAEQYFERNQPAIRTDLVSNYVNGGIASVNADANALFGYTPVGGRDFLWILDLEKHPEFESSRKRSRP